MKSKFFLPLFFLLLVGLAVLPAIARAYSLPNLWPTGFWGPIVSCTGNYNSPSGPGPTNPCTSICDLTDTVINFIYFGISVALFVFAPISFIIGGIYLITAGGNPGRMQTGKKILFGAVIGVVIVLCAYLIVLIFYNLITGANLGSLGVSCS